MRQVLENTDHLHIRQAEVSEIIVNDGVIGGVKTVSGAVYEANQSFYVQVYILRQDAYMAM